MQKYGKLLFTTVITTDYGKKTVLNEFNEEDLEMADTDGTEVEVRLGMTLCLPKQYEMARCDVFVRLPGNTDDAGALADKAETLAKEKLNELVARVNGR